MPEHSSPLGMPINTGDSEHLVKSEEFFVYRLKKQIRRLNGYQTELSHVVQVRAEGPKAPSPGHRPGYNGNQ